MSKTIFERVWDDEVPAYVTYRNDDHGLLAMLDIHPATPGHTLVVPREAVDQWTDLPDTRLHQMTQLGIFVARHMVETLTLNRVTRHTVGYGVPHVHDQYIPSYVRSDTSQLWRPGRLEEGVNHSSLAATAELLNFTPELVSRANDALDAIK